MAHAVTHAKVSAVPDSGDTTKVQPSDWNAGHVVVIDESAIDHGAIGGLSDDDHEQYHTDARALTWLGTRDTADLSEGSNLYYTDDRADARIALFADTLGTAAFADTGDFATAGHDHDGVYSPVGHNHDSDYAAISHTHLLADITDAGTAAAADTTDFAAAAHGHAISDVSGLQTALDGKASTSHTHTLLSLTDTPSSYSGQAGKFAKVNAGETAVEFDDVPGRQVLTGATTFNVPADFATPQAAWAHICANVDCNGFVPTIKIADGTHGGISDNITGAPLGAPYVAIDGNSANPENVILTEAAAETLLFLQSRVELSNFEFRSTGSFGLVAAYHGRVFVRAGLRAGACSGEKFHASSGGQIWLFNNYTDTGNAQKHFVAHSGGQIRAWGVTATPVGTPAYTTFAEAVLGGVITADSYTYGGSATGKRFNVESGGVIEQDDNDLEIFPGNAAGTVSPGGIYGSITAPRTVYGPLCPHEALKVLYASAATVTATASAVLLRDASGAERLFAGLSETPDITASGANGLDTGSEGSSRWYAIWAIGKPDGTLDALLSESFTAPTMPSGYTYKGLVGAVYNDGSSNFVAFNQAGNVVNRKTFDAVSGGAASTYTALDLSAGIPPNAKKVHVGIELEADAGLAIAVVAPEGSGTTNTYGDKAVAVDGGGAPMFAHVEIVLSTAQQIKYFIPSTGATNPAVDISVRGWEW
jgi:hypothetical protein